MFSITRALKSSVTGQFEVTRLIGGVGGLVYVIATHAFVAWEVIHLGKPFDIATYCLAFPTGLAAIGGSTAGAAALKDRSVATATVTATTGVLPVPAIPAVPPVQPSEEVEGEVPRRPAPPATVLSAPPAPAEVLPSYAQ
jgi:hypothetical protein